MIFSEIAPLVEDLILTGFAEPAPMRQDFNFVEKAEGFPVLPDQAIPGDARVLTCVTGYSEEHGRMVSVSVVIVPEGATLGPVEGA